MKANIATFEINGAKFGHYKMQSLEAAFIDCRFKAGSVYEKDEEWGALHLLEHMLFEKSRSFKNNQEIEIYTEENGIKKNGWTNIAEMGFWFKFPYTYFRETAHLMEEMLFYPIFTEKNLKREKSVIEQEYIDKYSSPYNRFSRAVRRQLYGDKHPYMRDAIGEPDYVNQITIEQLKKFHEKFIVPGNMFVGSAGRLAEGDFVETLSPAFMQLNKGNELNENVPNLESQSKYLWHREDVDLVEIYIQWFLPGRQNLSLEDRVRLNLASYILGGSARSNLYRRLRQDLGLVYGAGSSFYSWDKVSIFEAYASTSKKNARKVFREINSVVNKFINTPINQDVFDRSRNFMNMQTMLSYDSVGGISETFANSLVNQGKVIPGEDYIEMANTFHEEELRNLLAPYINEKALPYISVLSREDPKLDKITSI
jgi:predicted Zn-dependent peptidase